MSPSGVSGTLYSIKQFIMAGVPAFPIIAGGLALLLAASTASVGYLILFLCLALIVPMLTFGLNKLAVLLVPLIQMFAPDFSLATVTANVCKIAGQSAAAAADEAIPTLPSYWMTSVIFFFSFLFFNGLALYNYSASSEAEQKKVTVRKSQAVIGMVLSAVFLGLFMAWRLYSGCENALGVALALPFIPLAYGIFTMFESCGLLRVLDLYGIGGRLLPVSALAPPTQVCFPVAEGA